MEDLRKINGMKLYYMAKNFAIGLLTVLVVICLSKVLPPYMSPIVSLACAAYLYSLVSRNRNSSEALCMIVPYAIFIGMITYSFLSIILNILVMWKLMELPAEFVFLSHPFIPSLLVMPVFFVTIFFMMVRRRHLRFCINCRITHGDNIQRGKFGRILEYESKFQLRNLTLLFGLTSAVIWLYYLKIYVNINQNDRDWFIFVWIVVLAFVVDIVYFINRYYNLYLDLKEANQLIDPAKLAADTGGKAYLRYYVVCNEHVYSTEGPDPMNPTNMVIDTPFFITAYKSDLVNEKIQSMITDISGVKDGELRFFFGNMSTDYPDHFMMRYFYFMDVPEGSELPELKAPGKWIPFNKIKEIYSHNPSKLAQISVSDITRLATIIITSKMYTEKGFRRNALKRYRPTFTLKEVRDSDLDFQDDKWIKVASFNSDNKFFRLRRWMHGFYKKSQDKSWTLM